MLNRRQLLMYVLAQLGAAPTLHRALAQDVATEYGKARLSQTVVDTIAGMSLKELRNFHQNELDNDFLGYWEKHGIDWEYGGVMPYRETMVGMPYLAKHPQLKQMYFLGRALWTFSYLYNHFGRVEEHLAIARHTKDFIYKYARNNDYTWTSELKPDGRIIQGHSDIAGDFYVAMGLAEYHKATGDKEALDTALETIYSANRRVVSADFMFYGAWDSGVYEPGTRMLGNWLHFLNTLVPVMELTGDERVTKIADMCVRNIMNHHWRPEQGAFVELLDYNFEPLNLEHRDSNWHGVQAAWMCMRHALSTGRRNQFIDAMGMGYKQLKRAWGAFEKININATIQDLPRWGPLEDYMLFTLTAIEHTHAPWSVYWFDKVFRFAYQRPDRFEQYDLLHQPRRLFFTIHILDRMIAREGQVSDFLEG